MQRVFAALKRHRYFIVLALFVVAVFILPQFFMQLPRGHDLYYHMYRLDSLANELKTGNFNVRIYSTMFDGYGYASPMFYGDWLMVPAAILICMGMPVVTAYTVFILMCACLTAASMYFSAKYMFGSSRAGFVSAFAYVFSTYFFVDMFWRHAVGEMQSFIFLPIVMAGIYSIVIKDAKYWYLLGLGMCGMLISHLLTSVVTVVFLLLFCLVNLPKLVKKPKKLLYIAASVLLFFMASASFIFPMLEQMSSTMFVCTDGTSATTYGTLAHRSMPDILSLFNPINNQMEYSPYIPDGIGVAFLLPLVYRVMFAKDYKGKPTYIFLALAALALFATSFMFPWDALQEICGIIQFPWRLMIFVSLFVALFVGSVAPKNDGSLYCGVLIMLSMCAFTMSMAPKYSTYMKYAMNGTKVPYDYEYNIGVGEYLPSGLNYRTLTSLAQGGDRYFVSHPIESVEISRTNNILTAEFDGNYAQENWIDLPLVNYKGYAAYIEHDGVKEKAEISYGNYNLVRVSLPSGAVSGKITVLYEGTAVQAVSYCITVLTLLSFCGYMIYLLYRRAKFRPKPEVPLESAE